MLFLSNHFKPNPHYKDEELRARIGNYIDSIFEEVKKE